MTAPRDANGERLYKSVARAPGGWGATVWFGHDPATDVRRYLYRTRAEARRADISDPPDYRVR